jgi:small subunit ribosomal protein S16
VVKIRLKRLGYKKNPTYRVIVIDSRSKREGAAIEELGHYNPKTKEMKLDKTAALKWIEKGAQPTETVSYLIKNCDDEGKLVYKKTEAVKLSKKAQTKLEEEKKAKAEAEAKAKEEAAAAKAAAEEAKKAPAAEEAAPEAAEEAPAAEEASASE